MMSPSAIIAASTVACLLLLTGAARVPSAAAASPGGLNGQQGSCTAVGQDDSEVDEEEVGPVLLDGMSMMQTTRAVESLQAPSRVFQQKERSLTPSGRSDAGPASLKASADKGPSVSKSVFVAGPLLEEQLEKRSQSFYTVCIVTLTVFMALVVVSVFFLLTLRAPVQQRRDDCHCGLMLHRRELPELSLQKIGASFVVPLNHLAQCQDTKLGFDIAVLRAGVPLYAMLFRASKEQPWEKLVLTVDVLMAADLPPLFVCELFPSGASKAEKSTSSVSEGAGGIPWLLVSNGKGAPVASVVVSTDNQVMLRRWGMTDCDIEGVFGGQEPWVAVSENGHRIARARSCDEEESKEAEQVARAQETVQKEFRVDTETDTQSPDTCLLLLVMLAMVAFTAPTGAPGVKGAATSPSCEKSPLAASLAESLMFAPAGARAANFMVV